MKPILFNTEMVRGLLNGIKTATRRVVKLKYSNTHLEMRTGKYGTRLIELQNEEPGVTTVRNLNGTTTHKLLAAIERTPPYRPGDILYVRETFCRQPSKEYPFVYKASVETPAAWKGQWHPSIHMPREAARIFLRVTDVRAERLQDSFFKHGSTIFSLLREGIDIGEQCRECIDAYGSPCCIDSESDCGVLDEVRSEFADLWNRCYAAPRTVKGEDGTIDHYESYPWEDIQETRTYQGKPWYVIGNPWVWVIEFERCEKPEGD